MSTLAVVADWSQDPARLEVVRRMIDRLADRAPDGTAAVEAPGAALAFGKLVVSHKQGHRQQPLVDPAAGLYLVADVRIDNRDDLRPVLGLPAAATDAEIVLAGYKKWGPLVPDHLIGDFAFAVWNAREHHLFAARDPFGVRPLVYRRLPGGRLLLASDVEEILAVDPAAWKVDDRAVVDYLREAWCSAERTFWEPIKSLPAGHCLMASERSTDILRWWRWPSRPQVIEDHEACYREFRRRFSQAVADRLESDHPVLVHLSGGFDSTSIAVVAGAVGARVPLRAVGAVYPGLDCDESLYMDAVKARLPYPAEYWDGTRPVALDLEAPRLAGPGLRTFMVDGTRGDLEVARRTGARVVLSGYGGDVWGTTLASQRDYLRQGHWRQLWRDAFMLPRSSFRVRARVLRESLSFHTPAPVKALARRIHRRVNQGRNPTWLADAWSVSADREPLRPSPTHIEGGADQRRREELEAPRSAYVVDRSQTTAAADHLELRFPFLDLRCLDLLWRLPLGIWPARGYESRFHRRALSDLLPPEIVSRRRKTVFGAAMAPRGRLAQSSLRARSASGGRLHADRYCRSDHTVSLARADPGRLPSEDWRLLWHLGVLEAWLGMVYGEGRNPSRVEGNHGYWIESRRA
jgi:asparagine synthase (glutamine-hydrolysing)